MAAIIWLAVFFFLVALLYSSVGFGGGSTYTALLILSGITYQSVPTLSLICNIIVVTGGVWQFARAGHINLARTWPLILISVPAAWLGGNLVIPEKLLVTLLGFALVAAGTHLLLNWKPVEAGDESRNVPTPATLLVGGGIGFLSGIVGIGGGIFLAPILYLTRWGSARLIAATCSLFILVNSLAGLTGQIMKTGLETATGNISEYLPLFIAVLIGGQIGSRLGSFSLSQTFIKRATAALILVVAVRLLVRTWL
ncbi:sulfite exporter TauE/SafE family protein [Sphingorhabdus sp. Alg239-R122]|uniref:sulfite exporter TauE/SafE family protein n=1 Tax=Sphingorhabdus sp. Alg239-R122 TaxID=2305989 RepID=UPI0013DD37D6|nr:sulfite exporter TauE/SafE family protein [Sphingorhabdus sp. Alg239-R122]